MKHRLLFVAAAFASIAAITPANAVTYCIGNNGKVTYNSDGTYEYKNRNETWFGKWEGSPGTGEVRVTFTNGSSRSDTFKTVKGQLYFFTSSARLLARRC